MCLYVGPSPPEAGTDGGDVKDSDEKSEIDVPYNFYQEFIRKSTQLLYTVHKRYSSRTTFKWSCVLFLMNSSFYVRAFIPRTTNSCTSSNCHETTMATSTTSTGILKYWSTSLYALRPIEVIRQLFVYSLSPCTVQQPKRVDFFGVHIFYIWWHIF